MECSEKVAVYSVFFNTSLVILKYFFAQFSGSLAIMADAIHSLTDVIASLAILVGIKISKRQSKQFPYGLYKVENLVSLAMSILIIWVGFEIIKIAFGRECQIKTTQLPLTLFGIFLIIIFTFLFSKYEYNIGKRLNSPSLISDAQHIKADMLSTVAVFAGLIGEYLNVHLDRTVAFLVALFVIKAGGKIFIESIKILLEASLDASTLEKVKNIVLSHPAVKEIKEIRGRSSGRYKFIELILILKVSEFKKAHSVTEEIEKKIKEEILGVDHVLIHYEPLERDYTIYTVPLAEDKISISEHFGNAPYFCFIKTDLKNKKIIEEKIEKNPYFTQNKGKGIKVAKWLLKKDIDVLITRQDLSEKGPFFVLDKAGIEIELNNCYDLFSLKEKKCLKS